MEWGGGGGGGVAVAGKANVETDEQSRVLQNNTGWKLNPELFQRIVEKFGKPDIDLFATRINKQIESYVSWYPETEAIVTALPGTGVICKCSHPLVLQLSISHSGQGQDRLSDSCTRLVNSILVPTVGADDCPGSAIFSVITKKFDIAAQSCC